MMPPRLISSFLTPHSSLLRRRLRSGMTMVELVAALALFVIIIGSLMIVMDSATTLWSVSRGNNREQAAAQNALDLLADDLQQAVADNGLTTNATPMFIVDTRDDTLASSLNSPAIVLQLVRNWPRPSTSGNGIPLSLAAVYYTLYQGALYRYAVPLAYESDSTRDNLGVLLKDERSKNNVENEAYYDKLRTFLSKGDGSPTDIPQGLSLLGSGIVGFSLLTAIHEHYLSVGKFTEEIPAPTGDAGRFTPPEYDYLETDVLPDRVDAFIELLNAEQESVRISKRITLPAHGGSRLP